jgi:acyl-CoA thioester hydrolase
MATDTLPAPTPEYGVLLPERVHFDDLDPFGMLHNSRYTVMVERAWISYWMDKGAGFEASTAQAWGDAFNVVKELRITFDLPLNRMGDYAVHLWIERFGRTSATAGFRVCSADGTVTYAHGIRTIICLDPGTLRPTEWSDQVRALAQEIQGPQS